MKVEFVSKESRDFSQRYCHTYGWLEREDKPKVLVQVTEVNEDWVSFVDKNKLEYKALSDRGNWFSFLPVNKGCYLVKNNILVVQRVPARQWKRGICNENTQITDLEGRSYPITFPLLESIFKEEENLSIENFKHSLAGDLVLFNSQFSIYKNKVYVYDAVIGKYDFGKISLENTLFSQELKDIMVQNNLPVLVE